MEKTNKLWLVTRTRHTTDNDSTIICGIYGNFGDAVARVNEVFLEDEEVFEECYLDGGGEYEAENHNNGYAELHYGDSDYDDIEIKATEYEMDIATYDAL